MKLTINTYYLVILVTLSFQSQACEELSPPPYTPEITEIKLACEYPDKKIQLNVPSNAIKLNARLKSDGGWLKEILMLGTLFVSLFALILTIQNNKRQSINRLEDDFLREIDGFWYQEVITPKLIKPLLDFIHDQHKSFNLVDYKSPEEKKFALLKVLTEQNTELYLSTSIMDGVPSGSQYSLMIVNELEDLEDRLNTSLFYDESDALNFGTTKNNENNSQEINESIQGIFSEKLINILKMFESHRNLAKQEMKIAIKKNNK
jgi:hypothetical protein